MKRKVLYSSIALALAYVPVAQAYEAGDIVVRGGLTFVAPDDSSGNLIVNDPIGETDMTVSINSDMQLGVNAAFFFTQAWAVEVLASTPFKHTMSLNNSGAGFTDADLAEFSHLPPTVSVLWYVPTNMENIQPYVGAGVNYTLFFDEKVQSQSAEQGFSELSIDNSVGLALQAGVDYMFTENWMANGSIRFIDMGTTAEFSLDGNAGEVDVDIDPWVFTVAAGYKF